MLLSMDEFRAFEPKKTTYALFGWPLGHTMSPELHAQLFEAAGQDADYIGVAVPPEDLPEAFELAKRKLGGINCTIPHKKAVIPLLDDIDIAAYFNPPLTSIKTPCYEMGQMAANIMISAIESQTPLKVQYLLDTELIVRRTCGRVKEK